MIKHFSKQELLPYKLAGLLYIPAMNARAGEKIVTQSYPGLTSAAFCLEDSIMDDALPQAECVLQNNLDFIKNNFPKDEELPMLFVRVRTPKHMEHIHKLLGENENIISGYILPKFDLSNSEKYTELITEFNKARKKRLYIMPILESRMIAYKSTRLDVLIALKGTLSNVKKYVLNIRVGGNDFSNIYGLRRSSNQTIYDMGVIRDILVDIINVFGSEYVVSAPVWEYFGKDPSEEWATGLRRELELDRLNGFVGKTAIHPSQLPIIKESMKVAVSDYKDAVHILEWNSYSLGVSKSSDGSRMNEFKCHLRWARRIKIMGDLYGVKELNNN